MELDPILNSASVKLTPSPPPPLPQAERGEDIECLSIWDFALQFYAQAGVERDCLIAQDRYGFDVTMLIFALYRSRQGVGFDCPRGVELARTLSARIVEPLRNARIALKSVPSWVDNDAAQALRQTVKQAELDGERLTLNALASLPVAGTPLPAYDALIGIVDAAQIACDADLHALLKRLAFQAENMTMARDDVA